MCIRDSLGSVQPVAHITLTPGPSAAGAGYLRATDDVYKTLSLTAEGREVMSGRSTEAALTLNLLRSTAQRMVQLVDEIARLRAG